MKRTMTEQVGNLSHNSALPTLWHLAYKNNDLSACFHARVATDTSSDKTTFKPKTKKQSPGFFSVRDSTNTGPRAWTFDDLVLRVTCRLCGKIGLIGKPL